MDYELILQKIKGQKITLEEIKALHCPLFNRFILEYAFYEWNNMSFFIPKLLKDAQERFASSRKHLKTIKKLVERSRQKNKFFDIKFFQRLMIVETPQSTIEDDLEEKNNKTTQETINRLKKLNQEECYDEVIAIGSSFTYQNNENIQLQVIKSYMSLERLAKALTICTRPSFIWNTGMQRKRIEILVSQGFIDEAIAICKKKAFARAEMIQSIYRRLSEPITTIDESFSIPHGRTNFSAYRIAIEAKKHCLVRLIGDLQKIKEDKEQMKFKKEPRTE